MPVYGKGRLNRRVPKARRPPSRIYREDVPSTKKPGTLRKGTRSYVREFGWHKMDQTTLTKLRWARQFNIAEWVHAHALKTGRPSVVLDWGCGNGAAIAQLARLDPQHVRAYGFSKKSYSEWMKNKHVKFIQEEADRLPRYFKDESVDLIYSHYGLTHLIRAYGEMTLLQYGNYLHTLAQKLTSGGRMVIYPAEGIRDPKTWRRLTKLSVKEWGLTIDGQLLIIQRKK